MINLMRNNYVGSFMCWSLPIDCLVLRFKIKLSLSNSNEGHDNMFSEMYINVYMFEIKQRHLLKQI